VLAVRQRQIGRERVCLLGGRDYDGVEVVRVVEDFAEVVERLGFRKPLRRGVERVPVHVAQRDDVLVWVRCRRRGTSSARTGAGFRRDDEFLDVVFGTATAGDERDVQLVVQIPAPQQRRRASHDPGGRQSSADELTARQSTRAWRPDRLFLHGSAPGFAMPDGITIESGV
jgi:hypothetical protein